MSAVSKLSAAMGLALAAMGAPLVANGQVSDGVIKIGVLSDMSSLYADIGGPGSVVAARMAVEDYGAAKKGMKVEIPPPDPAGDGVPVGAGVASPAVLLVTTQSLIVSVPALFSL